jgi:hypothetical protein
VGAHVVVQTQCLECHMHFIKTCIVHNIEGGCQWITLFDTMQLHLMVNMSKGIHDQQKCQLMTFTQHQWQGQLGLNMEVDLLILTQQKHLGSND